MNMLLKGLKFHLQNGTSHYNVNPYSQARFSSYCIGRGRLEGSPECHRRDEPPEARAIGSARAQRIGGQGPWRQGRGGAWSIGGVCAPRQGAAAAGGRDTGGGE